MAVTAITTVAAFVYPMTASTADTTTIDATTHSNQGLPSWSSET